MSTLQSRGWRSLLLAVAICFTLVTLNWAPPSASAQFNTSGLDLAAIAINPFDLAILGVPTSVILEGRYLSPESASSLIVRSYRTSPESARNLIVANRAEWGYTLALEIPGSGGDGNQQVVSSLFQLDNPDGASSFFTGLTAHAESGVSIVNTSATVGDASQMVKSTIDQGSGGLIRTMQITFKTGNLIGIITISTRSSTDPTDRLTSIARQLLQKISIVNTGASPGISYRALRLRNVEPAIGAYIASQGKIAQIEDESSSTFRAHQQSYSTVTIGYRQQMAIPSGQPGTNLAIEISGFEIPDNASNWVSSAADRQRAIPGTSDVAIDSGAPSLGDASVTLTYHTEDGRQARQVTTRLGPYTFSLELSGADIPPKSAFDTLAEAQLSCLQTNAICSEIVIPSDLSPVEPTIAAALAFPADSNAAPTALPATPTATSVPATPTPTPSPTPQLSSPTAISSPATPHDVRTFMDSTYPFAVTYDASKWMLAQEGTSNNRSFARFNNGTSDIYFVAGVAYGADVNACLEDAHTGLQLEPGVTAVMPALNRDGAPVAGSSATEAYAVYTYRQGDNATMARYLKCTVLEPGVSTLLIIQVVPGHDFNDQIEARNSLLSGLIAGTETAPAP